MEWLQCQSGQGWHEPPVYAAVFGSAAAGTMTLQSDVDIFLVRDHNSSDTLWSDQVGKRVTTVTGWTGNDARIVEYTIDELRAARAEPMVRDVVDHGLTEFHDAAAPHSSPRGWRKVMAAA